LLSSKFVAPQEFVAVDDRFGESGTPSALLKKYGLETEDIIISARKVLQRK
ncbi:MAG: transketolase family protein, partial [Flavobacteriia bacterium]|nr:transketolase family protein [Flavobacteriia bacterium]